MAKAVRARVVRVKPNARAAGAHTFFGGLRRRCRRRGRHKACGPKRAYCTTRTLQRPRHLL